MQLSGFKQVQSAAQFGEYIAGVSWRFVCHMTQGFSSNIAATAAAHPNPPHLWVGLPSHPYQPRTKVQVVGLDLAARALLHPSGMPETNRARAIQVEIEGFSEHAQDLSTEDLDWLADEVIGPACRQMGVDASVFVPTVGSEGAGADKPQRLSWDAWYAFDGICGHQHVPGNDHWDPGLLDLAHISTRITGSSSTGTKPQLEDDGMALVSISDGRLVEILVNPGDHNIISRDWTPGQTAPGKFSTLAGGGPDGGFLSVAATVQQGGKIAVHARGNNGHLYWSEGWPGGFSSWGGCD